MRRVSRDELASVRVLGRDERDARRDADAIRAQARAESARLVEAARAEADSVRQSARAEGLARANAESVALLARARASALEAEPLDVERVSSLAAEIARVILGREASSGPEVLRDVARAALARVRRARHVLLRVHPEDLAYARAMIAGGLPGGVAPDWCEVDPDDSVERGGLVVECELGTVDARLAHQVEALRRAFLAP